MREEGGGRERGGREGERTAESPPPPLNQMHKQTISVLYVYLQGQSLFLLHSTCTSQTLPLLLPLVPSSSYTVNGIIYSETSDNGHSEEWTNSLQWTNCSSPALLPIHFYVAPKKGQPLNNGQNAHLQRVFGCVYRCMYYSGTSNKGHSEIGTTSLQGTKLLAPKCPLFGGSTVRCSFYI